MEYQQTNDYRRIAVNLYIDSIKNVFPLNTKGNPGNIGTEVKNRLKLDTLRSEFQLLKSGRTLRKWAPQEI